MKKSLFARTISLILALSFVFGLFIFSPAVSAEASGDREYEVDENCATITGYNGSGGDVTIPSDIEGYPVTGIGDRAFAYCESLTSVTVPASVTSIGDYALGWDIKWDGATGRADFVNVENFTISGYEGSAAQNYARECGFDFVPLGKPPVRFTDVKPGAYYADAVAWAVANNITAGTSATTFSPDKACTRGAGRHLPVARRG